MNKRLPAILLATAVLVFSSSAVAATSPWEPAPLGAQGAGFPTGADPVVGSAAVHRTTNGVSAQISMTLPESYLIPLAGPGSTSTGVGGTPEAFTLWVFIFFNPDSCIDGCDLTDLTMVPDVVAGGFNAGGHFREGTQLTIAGRVTQQSLVFPRPGGAPHPNVESLATALSQGFDLDDAEIHIAVAPHGELNLDLVAPPAQISTPAGNPGLWWLAHFAPQPQL